MYLSYYYKDKISRTAPYSFKHIVLVKNIRWENECNCYICIIANKIDLKRKGRDVLKKKGGGDIMKKRFKKKLKIDYLEIWLKKAIATKKLDLILRE